MSKVLDAISKSGFATVDMFILVFYLILLIGLGWFLSRNKNGKEKSANDYFLAGNTLTWWAVGASLIAANISAEQFIGMSGTGFRDGIATAAYEIMAAVTLIIVGKFLLPLMLERKIFTIPQFLRDRYNDGVGLAFSILWLFLYVFVNLTSVAWLGALAIEQILGLQGISVEIMGMTVSVRMLIIIGLYFIAGVYSIYGGLSSVAWTDVMQVTFLVGGGLVTAYFALKAVGGESGSFLDGFNKVYTYLTTGAHATDTHFHLIIQQSHNADAYNNVPGIAAVVGSLWITNLGYWGFNQYIIQKGLAAKSIDEAKKGLIFAGFLKILIPFIVLIPGVCAYYIMENISDYSGLQGQINVADEAYPWLIHNFAPVGIKGLSFAALAAAIISSLASMFNSTSTLFTMDIYKKYINKTASDKTLVNTGRLVALISLVIAAIAVKPLLGGLDQAFQYIQEYSSFIYPGIVIVFGMGLLWKRASANAAVWTAILTIPAGIVCKVMLPDTAFLFRSGYVFIFLMLFFVTMSYIDNKKVGCEQPTSADKHQLLFWARVLFTGAAVSIVVALIVTIAHVVDPTASPDSNILAYLNDIGFQAFYFFGALLFSVAIMLYSDATAKVRDPKALPIELNIFSTSRSFTIGSAGICGIVVLLYLLLW